MIYWFLVFLDFVNEKHTKNLIISPIAFLLFDDIPVNTQANFS